MRLNVLLSVFLCAVCSFSCSSRSNDRHYNLQGQVISLEPQQKLVTIKHEEIAGLMPAMTMPYEVQDQRALAGLAPGDLVNATLVVVSNGAYLSSIEKVGEAPLEKPPAVSPAPFVSSGFELLKPGEEVPNARFIDQDGRTRQFADFSGSPVVITFMYTRCPLANFCPLMDRHFAALQKPLHEDPALSSVHLVTVSFDPVTDTPPVLKAHARSLKADASRWTFLTGDRDEIDQFGARFGLSVARAPNDPRDITHNLRTAIVDSHGKLVKVYAGNEWTPEQVLSDLKHVA